MIKEETILLQIPVTYAQENDHHIINSNDATEKLLDIPVVVQADSKEEAIEKYWIIVQSHLRFHQWIYRRHSRWALFYRGAWKGMATHWFSVLGFNFYFRRGKGMKGGFYIPFTKLNITFRNHWRKKYSPKITTQP